MLCEITSLADAKQGKMLASYAAHRHNIYSYNDDAMTVSAHNPAVLLRLLTCLW